MWKEEYNSLLANLLNDMLDNKFSPEERTSFLFNRMTKGNERELKLRLIQHEVELFKESDQFQKQIEDAVNFKVQEKFEAEVEIERQKIRDEFEERIKELEDEADEAAGLAGDLSIEMNEIDENLESPNGTPQEDQDAHIDSIGVDGVDTREDEKYSDAKYKLSIPAY